MKTLYLLEVKDCFIYQHMLKKNLGFNLDCYAGMLNNFPYQNFLNLLFALEAFIFSCLLK